MIPSGRSSVVTNLSVSGRLDTVAFTLCTVYCKEPSYSCDISHTKLHYIRKGSQSDNIILQDTLGWRCFRRHHDCTLSVMGLGMVRCLAAFMSAQLATFAGTV